MNEFITDAFSIICNNEDVFEFTQKNGLHGVAICNTADPDEIWFNPKLIHSLGYKEAVMWTWNKIVFSGDIEIIEKILTSSKYPGNILSGEFNFIHSKGFLIPMTYKAIHIEQKVVIAVKKVTDYSHVEYNPDLNFQREQLIETILNTLDIGIIACDENGDLTLFNKAAQEWHGLPAEKIPHTEYASYYSLFEADGKTLFRTEDLPLLTMLTEGVIRKNEMIIKSKEGKQKFLAINGARLYDERRNISGAVIALYNITERKQIEDQLEISEKMFRGTFENAVNGMAISDPRGKLSAINESLCKMVGYSSVELKKINFLEITHPEDIQDDLKLMKELLNSEREYIHKEKRFIHKNGKIIHVLLSVSLVKDHKSDPLYMIAQMSDITELKSAQKEISRILGITEEQNERLKNFANIVSHNLRSHSGNIEMLLDIYTEEHPEAKENGIIKMGLIASAKLKETIVDLNEVAFINTSVSHRLIPNNLRKSVNATLNSINALIRKANLQVINAIPEELEVLSVPAYMESILLNFATNAIKYRSTKRDPMLRFEALKRDEYIELSIEDNGIGIDLNKFGEKIFGMYKTFHQNEDAKGIGLFITKNQIEALGGKIEVESEVDKGTVFTIFFQYEQN